MALRGQGYDGSSGAVAGFVSGPCDALLLSGRAGVLFRRNLMRPAAPVRQQRKRGWLGNRSAPGLCGDVRVLW